MYCNLKMIRPTRFKFLHFYLQNVLQRIVSCSFQDFSSFPSLGVLELFFNEAKVMLHHFHQKCQNPRDTSRLIKLACVWTWLCCCVYYVSHYIFHDFLVDDKS